MFKDDEQWVRDRLLMLPTRLQQQALDNYRKIYATAYAEKAALGELQQIQHARTTANTRLRKYVQAVIERNKND